MARVPARELMKGEMIAQLWTNCTLGEEEMWFTHGYYRVIGHKHEEKKVICDWVGAYDSGYQRIRELDYEDLVTVAPFRYKTIRDELRPDWYAYKVWPYDEKGVFCDPPRDYSNWKPDAPKQPEATAVER